MAKLPVSDFLEARLLEYDPNFQVRKGTAFSQLVFKPLQFIIQPLIDDAIQMRVEQSFLRILQQADPDAFSEEAVDALASNLFVDRYPGGKSGGTARVYYTSPVSREWAANGTVFTGSNGLKYTNPSVFSITSAQMSLNIETGLYYYDIPIESEDSGEDTELEEGGIVSIDNDSEASTATNKEALTGGKDRETNTEFIERIRNSIAVRDLVTGKGFSATMFENFASSLTELQPIGFGDKEMMRDIQYNIHLGGKVDGYFKTAKILQGSKSFIGVLIDTTRQAYSSTNVQLFETDTGYVPDGNFDVSNNKRPIVRQLKTATKARYLSTVDLSGDNDLSTYNRVKIGIDGVVYELSLAGSNPSTTTRAEIINTINSAFGYTVAFEVGVSIELRTSTRGQSSEITLDNPNVGDTALLSVFGLSIPAVFYGDGPITFTETTHYTIDAIDGGITRVVGPLIVSDGVSPKTTGEMTVGLPQFIDATTDVFSGVVQNDILTINPNSTATSPVELVRKDFRILGVTNNNTLVLDEDAEFTGTNISYVIRRTGIKDEESVYVEYWFNPISIDIGPNVLLDDEGNRGVRPGREDMTITDVAFLKINSIEIIDPITEEATGEVLSLGGGYGQGGYGEGPYGSGAGGDYYVVVNSPHERFSAFEDSFIVIHQGLIGLSFRVNYDYVPECVTYHDFVRSENERVLDADILMKHFLPAYVSGNISYKVDSTDTSIPDNDSLTTLVKEFINVQRAGTALEISDITQFITRTTDPYDRYGSYVKPFTLTAEIHNADGATTIISSGDKLVVPEPSPFPKDTNRPRTARITHWIADEIVLTRLED
jgi:hypothetical protein